MADLSKPQGLTGLYQVEPAPSPLTKPYNLTAEYDAAAGGGEQYVNVDGFDSLTIGGAKLLFTQSIQPSGLDYLAFGSPQLNNVNQSAVVS